MNIQEIFSKNKINLILNEPLAQYATIKIGGKAKYFVKATDSKTLLQSLKTAHSAGLKYFVLGAGSNVIISDKGFDGLVILNESEGFSVEGETPCGNGASELRPRFSAIKSSFLEGDENNSSECVIVKADSGVKLQKLMKKLFNENIVGLEYFAGIPATVGGAIYMNIHGANKFFSEFVHSALLYGNGKTKRVAAKYFKFDYDWSLLHETGEIVIWAKLKFKKGDGVRKLRAAKEWAERKSSQPRVSAGCVFKNISEGDRRKLNLPTHSVAFVIDKLLRLKGCEIGGAKISENHAAFIENMGNATAEDVLKLIKLVRKSAREKLGLNLELEVEIIGETNGKI